MRIPATSAAVLTLATVTTSLAIPTTARADTPDRSPAPRYITDAHGRALILHGLNTAGSAKDSTGLPWIDRDDVVTEARAVGSNVVRYLIQWKNVEPRPGHYDDRYLRAVARRVKWYRSQGIHVVLDMHQDLYGPKTTGNGAPGWATHTDGLPTVRQTPWLFTYQQPGVTRAFDNLWNSTGRHPELAVRYAKMFRHVARWFAHNDAVLGYDLMNEPWGGSTQGAAFEGPILAPFYQRVINAIRRVDRRHWIFVEPQANGVNWGESSWLGRLDDPRRSADRLVYAPHLYPLQLDLGTGYTGDNKAKVRAQMTKWRTSTTSAARRLHMPVWLGEFGGISYESLPGALDYYDDTMDLADDMTIGWAFWSNDHGSSAARNADGTWNAAGKRLVRPYPRAIAGTPKKTDYNRDAARLTVTWRDRRGVRGPTEIWLPKTGFPHGPRVRTAHGARLRTRWNPRQHVLYVYARHGHRHHQATHTVTVTPR